jgi:hypothetical protein
MGASQRDLRAGIFVTLRLENFNPPPGSERTGPLCLPETWRDALKTAYVRWLEGNDQLVPSPPQTCTAAPPSDGFQPTSAQGPRPTVAPSLPPTSTVAPPDPTSTAEPPPTARAVPRFSIKCESTGDGGFRVGRDVTCDVIQEPGNVDSCLWAAEGGSPHEGFCENFTTKFATAGPHTITVDLIIASIARTESTVIHVQE